MKYRDPIIEATGRMPLSGKHMAKFAYEKGKEAGKNGNILGKVACATGLGLFGALHGVQLKMGITELAHHSSQNVVEVGIDAAYTVVNGMVLYTHTALAGLALFTRKDKTIPAESEQIPVLEPAMAGGYAPETYLPDYSSTAPTKSKVKLGQLTLTEFAFTLAGQIAFTSTMVGKH